jgi:hypothetical protein
VCSKNQEALYFSRSVIPYFRNMEQAEWVTHHTYYKHIGMYAYRADVLEQITKLEISSLEKTESLEQLRWIENGYAIYVAITKFLGLDPKGAGDRFVAAEKLKQKAVQETRRLNESAAEQEAIIAEQREIMADKEAYDDVFEELYEKYSNNISVGPEIKLITMVIGSAFGYHMKKYMSKQLSKASGKSQV